MREAYSHGNVSHGMIVFGVLRVWKLRGNGESKIVRAVSAVSGLVKDRETIRTMVSPGEFPTTLPPHVNARDIARRGVIRLLSRFAMDATTVTRMRMRA